MAKTKSPVTLLELGNIYFLYRPKVEKNMVKSFADVEHFFAVLHPCDKNIYRLIVIGEKHLPLFKNIDRITWGFVDKVVKKPQVLDRILGKEIYQTKTRGKRFIEAVRLAGEGMYEIVRHANHTHLIYVLENPAFLGEVQKSLDIVKEGSYILSIKNPEKPSPKGVGLRSSQEANYPKNLQAQFRGHRFSPADPPNFLNYPGTQLLLIGASEDVSGELGIEFNPAGEQSCNLAVFQDLKIKKTPQNTLPLFEGRWA